MMRGSIVSKEKEGVVFLLWGKFAIKKAQGVDSKKHHILEAAHPSPLVSDRLPQRGLSLHARTHARIL
jgi:uracil DNA glycosylase